MFMLQKLVAMIKDVRQKASSIVKEMAAKLLKLNEAEGTADSRSAFVQACTPVTIGQVRTVVLILYGLPNIATRTD